MSDSFKIYTDEESTKLKKSLLDTLTNINSQMNKFMEKYNSLPKLQKEINQMIYKHQIYNRRKICSKFSEIIYKTGQVDAKEIESRKEKTIMYQKRNEEIETIKDFVQTNYLKMLPDSNADNNDEPLKLPSKKQKIDENITIFSNNKEESKNKKKSSNVLVEPKEEEEDKKSSSDDDIKIETVPSHTPNYLKKKKKRQKNETTINNINNSIFFKGCYICKEKFTDDNSHHFYSNLCKKCGDFNYNFRVMKLDFTGRIAVVTGGRVKIGYYIATKLLSYGCKVLITSRFPKDTLLKYESAEGYDNWKDNLLIYPIDFRLFESTVKFVKFINEIFPHVDILINNAAQTIRRTTSYYKYLLPNEAKTFTPEQERKIVKNDYINLKSQLLQLEKGEDDYNKKNSLISLSKNTEDKATLPLSVIASQIKIMEEKEQPTKTMIGSDGQTYDFSIGKSSWNLELDEVPFQEFTEVQIINTWTPYYLCVKLKPTMMKSPFPDRYIVNVTSVEGIFSHFKKTTHPHTNMAKAALNMMTRTCGNYYKNFGIYMTSVDTGWVSPMNEMSSLMDNKKKERYEREFKNIPLDEVDGAMRVLHPIIDGIVNKNYFYGVLLKDYTKAAW